MKCSEKITGKGGLWLIITAMIWLAGCGIEVPDERFEYVGYWHGEDMLLEIQADGDVSYFRKEGEQVTTIDSPIQKFEGDDFTIGYLFFTENFDVDKAPFLDTDGKWRMVVNGVLLTRQNVDLPEYRR